MTDSPLFDSLKQGEKQYIWELLKTGLYGETVEDVVRELVREGLRRALENGIIPRITE